MRRLRRIIGICLILALTCCALISIPAFADGGGSQGQTKSGQLGPAPAPETPNPSLWVIWMWLLIFF